jgi:holo-[acyl-carrier protein] synthase
MIIGIGVDVVELERFQSKLDGTPALIERIFTPNEREQSAQSLAGCWAAKEAVIKVLGNPVGLSWHEVAVTKNELGKPFLDISGESATRAQAMGITSWHLSISHDGGIACAMVVAEAGA